jgi:nucleoside-diphosphate-sugar epimerase
MTDQTQKTALIIGATGSFGGHTAVALIKHGWRIRALARDPKAAMAKTGDRMPIDWIEGDGMNPADVLAAAQGVSVIVHAANPPGYRNWRGLAVPMLEATIAAAKAVGARIVLPGNVYNFAPDSGAHIAEDHPQRPVTRKGRIRVDMERMLRRASEGGVPALVIRAGDYFGPAAPNSGLGWMTTRSHGKLRSVYSPGPADVGHAWAYLPDLAEATAQVLDRQDRLARFEVFHFAGQWMDRADEMGASLRRVTGQSKLPIKAFPYPMIYALAPFVETFRELIEMRYLWRKPIGLDNTKLVKFLGAEPHTPLDQATRATMADMGCLPEPVFERPLLGAPHLTAGLG